MDWIKGALSWIPTSETLLEASESRVLEVVKCPLRSLLVKISNENLIRTIHTEVNDKKTPLVLLHGFAAGLGFWALNIDQLSHNQNVYAIDLLGFGRSSRPDFPTDSVGIENMYIESIEEWKKKLGLKKVVLCGHSFGAYLACLYALKHPEGVAHLVLADPWGFPEQPPKGEEIIKLTKLRKAVYTLLGSHNPFSILRLVGPYGPKLVKYMRPDIEKKYEGIFGKDDTRVMDYLYHCNVQTPTGEAAFMNLATNKIPAYAKKPLIKRLGGMDNKVPVTIICGKESWTMKLFDIGRVQKEFPGKCIDVKSISNAGHHVFVDQIDEFNKLVCEVCNMVEKLKDDNETNNDGEIDDEVHP